MPETDSQPEVRLRCLPGNPVPRQVLEDWKRVLRFSAEARSDFWNVLWPALLRPNNPGNKELVKAFCLRYELPEGDVIAALRSCDFLVRQASGLNLDRAAFQEDLATLSESDPEAGDFILSRFDEAKQELRKQIILESLSEHGKVIVGLDWRVDNMSASDRGAQLNTNVVFLSLRYRDGDRRERITFQLTPEAMKELKLFCDRFPV